MMSRSVQNRSTRKTLIFGEIWARAGLVKSIYPFLFFPTEPDSGTASQLSRFRILPTLPSPSRCLGRAASTPQGRGQASESDPEIVFPK